MRVPDGSVLLSGIDCAALRPMLVRKLLTAECRRAGLAGLDRRLQGVLDELCSAADAAMARAAAAATTGSTSAMTGSIPEDTEQRGDRVDSLVEVATITSWLSSARAQHRLGIGERQMRRLRESGRVIGRKQGRGYVYELRSVIEEQRRRGRIDDPAELRLEELDLATRR